MSTVSGKYLSKSEYAHFTVSEFSPAYGTLVFSKCFVQAEMDELTNMNTNTVHRNKVKGLFVLVSLKNNHSEIKRAHFRDRPDCSVQYSMLSNLVSGVVFWR